MTISGPVSVYVGVDVGGTFTDLVLFNAASGDVYVVKVPSTPPEFSEGVLAAIRQAMTDVAGMRVVRLAHGTTVGTNTVLEHKGAKVALITTEGFRDVLEIGRQDRDDIYDLMYEKAAPLVPRARRLIVAERVNAQGGVVRPLDEKSARVAIRQAVARDAESIAVSLLNSFANATHERRIAELSSEEAPDLPVTLSSEVLAEFREFERTATTAMNAYIGPVTSRYLGRLADALVEEGIDTSLGVMQSNGGLLPARAAGKLAVGALLSGPAAGVVGAVAVARVAGFEDVISFDMGGTSCDVALVAGGAPNIAVGGRLGGYPIQLPMLDIHTVGAGGGSIARLVSGALKVGPESAGATPGPVCYGKGGIHPTVSDAHAVLGRISTGRFLKGQASLDIATASEVMDDVIASEMGVSVHEAALGILAVADDHMRHAIRAVSVERGYDPRPSVLVAYGGAGPLHAVNVARLLGIERVMIPLIPGALSAFGLLLAETRRDLVRTWLANLEDIHAPSLESAFQALEEDGIAQLRDEGVSQAAIWTTRTADMRYRGQAYELMVDVPHPVDAQAIAALNAKFHGAHEAAYGHSASASPTELVNIRVQVWGQVPKPALQKLAATGRALADACVDTRPVTTPAGTASVPIFDRTLLEPGHQIAGAAVIEQPDTTTVIYEGDRLRVDDYGNLIVEVQAA